MPSSVLSVMDTIKTIIFTLAPEGADYSYATTLETFEAVPYCGQSAKTFRKVEINASNYQTRYQILRYGSFLGGFPTMDDPREVPYGLGRSPDV